MPAHIYWEMYGAELPNLRGACMRVLCLVSSSSACERTWSTYEYIHSKKRNRLTAPRCNDLVWVFTNTRLRNKLLHPKYEADMVEWSDPEESEEEEKAAPGADSDRDEWDEGTDMDEEDDRASSPTPPSSPDRGTVRIRRGTTTATTVLPARTQAISGRAGGAGAGGGRAAGAAFKLPRVNSGSGASGSGTRDLAESGDSGHGTQPAMAAAAARADPRGKRPMAYPAAQPAAQQRRLGPGDGSAYINQLLANIPKP
jgi:hypothetical protein